MLCQRARTKVRRRCYDSCHTCADTVSSGKPLPLEPKHPEQVRTTMFDYCRALTNLAFGGVVTIDLSMLGKGKGKEGKGENNKEKTTREKKARMKKGTGTGPGSGTGKGKGHCKGKGKTTKYFDGYCFHCKAIHISLECYYFPMMKKLSCLTLHSGCIR